MSRHTWATCTHPVPFAYCITVTSSSCNAVVSVEVGSLRDSIASSEVIRFLSCLLVKSRHFNEFLWNLSFASMHTSFSLFQQMRCRGQGKMIYEEVAHAEYSPRAESRKAAQVHCWLRVSPRQTFPCFFLFPGEFMPRDALLLFQL